MKAALLLIDIQNDYFPDGSNTLNGSIAASENAKRILEKFRNENMPVIHIRHIALRADATFFLPGTIGAEIHANVSPVISEKVIEKHFPNSFRDTSLLQHLKALEITDLVICGMMTHMCVDSTVRAAKDYGFNCTVIGDACATKDLRYNGHIVKADEVQNSFLSALSYFYSVVISASDYIDNK